MNKKKIIILVVFIAVVILGWMFRNKIIKDTYFEEYSLIVNNEIIDNHKDFYYDKEDIFISKELAIKILKDRVYDSKEGIRLYIKRDAFNFFMPTEKLDRYVSEIENINIPYENNNGQKYISLSLLSEVTYLDYYYNISRDILMIDDMTMMKDFYQIGSNTARVKSKIDGGVTLDKLIMNEVVRIVGKEGSKYKVITDKCVVGYIEEDEVKIKKVEKKFNNDIFRENKAKFSNNQISSTFIQLSSYNNNKEYIGKFNDKAINVVIPTWFSLRRDGIVLNNCDKKLVNSLHDNKIKVWGLFDNSFDIDLTSEFLNDSSSVNNAIGQIVTYCAMYNLDGINIDFENIYLKDSSSLTMFVRKLSDALDDMNMDVSIDVTVPWGSDNWSKVYDRTSLNKYVDYFILMAYDEHWASSPVAGSVASYPWVEKGVEESLKLVDKDKLILGLPYYTRIWYDSGTKIKSKAIPIKNMRNHLKNKDKEWLDEEKQYYVEYIEDGSNIKIWFEEEESLSHKMNLVKKYDIKGIASWTFDYGDDLIYENIKNHLDVKRR